MGRDRTKLRRQAVARWNTIVWFRNRKVPYVQELKVDGMLRKHDGKTAAASVVA
jgi:hypothetical protein